MIPNLILFLIGFPILSGLILLPIRSAPLRTTILKVLAGTIMAATVALFVLSVGFNSLAFEFEAAVFEYAFLAVELAMLFFIMKKSASRRKIGAFIAASVQALLAVGLLFASSGAHAAHTFVIDKLTIVMAAIIGIVGSLICVYAIGYMKDFHKHHKELPDKRRFFAFYLFLFLGAMFGIVFANNLSWLNFFWEVTTFCSFVMIGYSETKEATDNSFKAVFLNLLGGIAFTAALIYLTANTGILGMDGLLAMERSGSKIGLAVGAALCFAGLVKAAQFPFSGWLLGAMVAPTPVSALLHSSTMVKAGVYLVLRVIPLLAGTLVANTVALIGGITFLFGSLLAVTQSNAKKVLAYSTVANLGLIVACAGVGTSETITAAILLIIFHAVAKSLLFLCVGTVEHYIGSRDIEDMDWLIMRLPKVAVAMIIGIAGMFLPPFGMLISKWLVLKAFVDTHLVLGPFLILTLAFGSVFNLLFWAKWLGKIIMTVRRQIPVKKPIHLEEMVIIWILAALTIGTCLVLPLISTYVITPYVNDPAFADAFASNLVILSVMVLMILILPLGLLFMGKNMKKASPYLSGRTVDGQGLYEGTMGKQLPVTMRNYYFTDIFRESTLRRAGATFACICLAVIVLGIII